MLDRILVPLDGSTRAEAILPQVRRLLRRKDSELVLLQATEPATSVRFSNQMEAQRVEARRYIQKMAATLLERGAQSRGVTRDGGPAEVILDTAKLEGATMIAMSTHGRTGLARWALGSVTEKVVRGADVPVLVVRSFSAAEEPGIKTILMPLDGSDIAASIIDPVTDLAQVFDAQVIVVHAIDGTDGPRTAAMSAIVDRLAERGIRGGLVVREGDPASLILDVCRERGAGMIAMTTHGRSGLSRWMLGSVAEKVLRAATVPTLIVRGLPVTAAEAAHGGLKP